MNNRLISVKKLATNIVNKYNLNPPVDPVSIIESYGVKIIEGQNQYGIEAYTNLGNSNEIYINTDITFAPRKKFTLAHELGHIIIPWHNGDIKCNTDTPYNFIGGKRLLDIQELEANIFASELLMPNEWIKQQIPNEDIDLEELIKSIKDKAETSVMACLYALENALPSGHLYYVKKDNTEYWKKFASCRTAIDTIYYNKDDNISFLDNICERKKSFHISQYDIVHYTLYPCLTSTEIKKIYISCNDNVAELINILSEYQPRKLFPVVNYILKQLDEPYVCILFKNNQLLKKICSHQTSIKIYCSDFYNYINIMDKFYEQYSIIEDGEYKLVVLKESVYYPPDVLFTDPNLLLKKITAEIYVDAHKMLQKINAIVSSANSANKTASENQIYSILKHRFALDDTFESFYTHPDFDNYLVNKIRSMISKRKNK